MRIQMNKHSEVALETNRMHDNGLLVLHRPFSPEDVGFRNS